MAIPAKARTTNTLRRSGGIVRRKEHVTASHVVSFVSYEEAAWKSLHLSD